jgi:hypothetical protein
MNNEVWKPVVGYEGCYEVSDHGRIRSLERTGTKGGILKQKDRQGYLCVDLSKGDKKRTIDVHRIVATAFIPNPDELPCVNHKDETRTNNNVDNLEWCSHQYNIVYGSGLERALATKEKARRPFICLETGRVYRSQTKFAKEYGVTPGFINNVLNGRRGSNNFKIKYVD